MKMRSVAGWRAGGRAGCLPANFDGILVAFRYTWVTFMAYGVPYTRTRIGVPVAAYPYPVRIHFAFHVRRSRIFHQMEIYISTKWEMRERKNEKKTEGSRGAAVD